MLSESKRIELRKLHESGLSVKDIAEILEISQPTVRSYLKDESRGVVKKERKRRACLLDEADQKALIDTYIQGGYNSKLMSSLINQNPAKYGLDDDFVVSLRTVRRYMSKVAPKAAVDTPKASSSEFEPGQQLQISFNFTEFQFPSEDSPRELNVFTAVYPWSRKSFFKVLPDVSQASWLQGIEECLMMYGVPDEIICDGANSFLKSQGASKDIALNTQFKSCCDKFGLEPNDFSVASSKAIASVSRAGSFFNKNCLFWVKLEHPEVSSIEELNEAIQEWNESYATDERQFKVEIDGNEKKLSVRELYKIESAHLKHIS